LRHIDSWDVPNGAAAVVFGANEIASHGNSEHVFRWASVTKLLTAYALLIAVEEGAVDLDDPAGPDGSTLRHLAAHASGLPFEVGGRPVAPPGRRRIYSNAGYVELAAALERATEIPFAQYLAEAVTSPLGMSGELRDDGSGAAAAGYHGTLLDLVAFARELRTATLVAGETLDEATSVQFPGLNGVLPDFGRMDPNDWGIGFELRDAKSPHWTGTRNSPSTFGHFGGSGTFLWVDPDAGVALGCLTDLEFGDWAKEAWPRLSDAVLGEEA
jgi:CubicO group peptidase (beta-lactamase class C family)